MIFIKRFLVFIVLISFFTLAGTSQEDNRSGYIGPTVGFSINLNKSLRNEGLPLDTTFVFNSTGININIIDLILNIKDNLGFAFTYGASTSKNKLNSENSFAIGGGILGGLNYHIQPKPKLFVDFNVKVGFMFFIFTGVDINNEDIAAGLGETMVLGTGIRYNPARRFVLRLSNDFTISRPKMIDLKKLNMPTYNINLSIGYSLKGRSKKENNSTANRL